MEVESLEQKINFIRIDISDLKKSFDCIDNKIGKMSIITIKANGQKVEKMYKREQFFQMLYDRKLIWQSTKYAVKDIILILTLVTMLLKLFNII